MDSPGRLQDTKNGHAPEEPCGSLSSPVGPQTAEHAQRSLLAACLKCDDAQWKFMDQLAGFYSDYLDRIDSLFAIWWIMCSKSLTRSAGLGCTKCLP